MSRNLASCISFILNSAVSVKLLISLILSGCSEVTLWRKCMLELVLKKSHTMHFKIKIRKSPGLITKSMDLHSPIKDV